MKKFIFGLMLLVSMLGIVGCSNPSNSEEEVYTIINKTGLDLNISYYSISNGLYANEKLVKNGESYSAEKSDVLTNATGAGDLTAYFIINKFEFTLTSLLLVSQLDKGPVIITQDMLKSNRPQES